MKLLITYVHCCREEISLPPALQHNFAVEAEARRQAQVKVRPTPVQNGIQTYNPLVTNP